MTAAEVKASLRKRWPDAEYLTIEEAPEASDRGGRKIDLLAISLWRSRGLEVDAVEVKVSASDWKRELERGGKADFWWRHSHRFWLAVPALLAAKVREDLPSGWGLLACDETGSKVIVKPLRREAEPMAWGTCVGLMRAAASAGINALSRAEQRGIEEGRKRGKAEALRESGDGYAARQLQSLQRVVDAFEKASGISISAGYPEGTEMGTLVAVVQKEMRNPGWLVENIGRAADDAAQAAERLVKEARAARDKAAYVSAALALASLRPAPVEVGTPPDTHTTTLFDDEPQ